MTHEKNRGCCFAAVLFLALLAILSSVLFEGVKRLYPQRFVAYVEESAQEFGLDPLLVGLADVLPAEVGTGIVVDCRSTSYRNAWKPTPELAERWVVVDVPGASHWAKHTRGLVARRLCQTDVVKRVADLPAALGEAFDVELVMPQRAGRPWTALVTAR